jgi:hypothetical protein
VVIIKRFLYKESSKNPFNEMTTVLTRSGYTLKHCWGETINNKLIIRNTMRITKYGCVHEDPMLSLKKKMEQDPRLKSMFLNEIVNIDNKNNCM